MSKTEVRWQQRLDNYMAAFAQLESAVALAKTRSLTELEKQGMIQAFEFTHELGWNVLKDYLTYQGITGLVGSRDTAREAFQKGIITDGDAWMEMIKSRNLTSHTYQKKVADAIIANITTIYFRCFSDLAAKMQALKNNA